MCVPVNAVDKVEAAVDFVCVPVEAVDKVGLHCFPHLIETSSL